MTATLDPEIARSLVQSSDKVRAASRDTWFTTAGAAIRDLLLGEAVEAGLLPRRDLIDALAGAALDVPGAVPDLDHAVRLVSSLIDVVVVSGVEVTAEELPESAGDAIEASDDDRPVIEVTAEMHEVNDLAVEALSRDPAIMQRSPGILVTALPAPDKVPGVRHSRGMLAIRPMQASGLRERLSRVARFERRKVNDKGEVTTTPVVPPEWAPPAILQRGSWPSVRYLRGVAANPIVRPDGSIFVGPGYDSQTGILVADHRLAIQVPERPTRDHARAAISGLFSVVSDFPFSEPVDSAAWVAAVLTLVARHAIDGPTPLFDMEANIRGAGKSLLADTAGRIVMGRSMPAMTYPHSTEEMEKVMTSVALSGLQAINFDNATGIIGGDAFDKWITQTSPMARVLGKSQDVHFDDWNTVLFLTANNAAIQDETERRTVPIHLESPHERPERRTDFRIPNLPVHVHQHRGDLLSCALTVLRAHAAAGRPVPDGLKHMGTFEAWTSVVRDALSWAGCPDVVRDEEGAGSGDEVKGALSAFLAAIEALDSDRRGVTVAQLLQAADDARRGKVVSGAHELALEAVRAVDPSPNPNAKRVGRMLRSQRRRWLDGRRITSNPDPHAKVQRWSVEARGGDPAGYAVSAGSVSPTCDEKISACPLLDWKSPAAGGGPDPAIPAIPADDELDPGEEVLT